MGRRISQEALSRGHEVVGVVRDPAAVQPPDPRVRLVKGNATRAEDVARVVRGADAVVSAISPRPNARGLPAPSLATNARARTGKYRTTGDRLLTDSAGKSFISFEDYAVAVLDELERPRHIGERFGVAY
ncbi:MAG TPA: NAD(P)H-binding protein [Gemmatimonadales bacterium]|nr:NAD(P)H-binding protein [Gemmatimonadales bacterium]